eukprot:TRINITY_DN11685_c0_g1_i1.p1 TRINITY_DN11685_c0_g1~~TRINITY_DN11685_c0_g1_i1.p1  ORF type:complete len:618 (+),score=91.82 TRINITY_DN11685_c0_g1_i1:131-1984(+)
MVPRIEGAPDLWAEYIRQCRLAAADHVAAQTKLTEQLVSGLHALQMPLSLSEKDLAADDKMRNSLRHVCVGCALGKKTMGDFPTMLEGLQIVSIDSGCGPKCLETPELSHSLGLRSAKLLTVESNDDVAPAFLHRTDLHLQKKGSKILRGIQKAFGKESIFIRLWEGSYQEPEDMGVVHGLVTSRFFQVLSATVIVLHTLRMIASTNASMRATCKQSSNGSLGTQQSEDVEWVDSVFLICYAIELALRLWAYRSRFFFNNEACWNILDVVLVGVSLVGFANSEHSTNLLAMRSARILKFARLVRVVRAMRFFKPLQLFIDIILGCCGNLFWAALMVLLVLLLFSMFFVQMMDNWLVANWSPDATEEVLETGAGIMEMFGSVQRAMLTLSEAVSGGMDWGEAYDVAEKTGYTNGLVFLCMVAFFFLAVWNIVASVFIENTIHVATVSYEQRVLHEHKVAAFDAKELMDLCKVADVNGSGGFSAEEFQAFISSPKVRNFFVARNLDIKNAEHFFEMLNGASQGDELSLEDFVGSCLRVKGAATSIDLQMLAFEHKVMAQRMKRFINFASAALQELSDKQDQALFQIAEAQLSTGRRGQWPDASCGDCPFQGEIKRCYTP